MLVRVCDVCGKKINKDDYINIQGGSIRNKDTYVNVITREIHEFDICMSCARSLNLAQIIVTIVK